MTSFGHPDCAALSITGEHSEEPSSESVSEGLFARSGETSLAFFNRKGLKMDCTRGFGISKVGGQAGVGAGDCTTSMGAGSGLATGLEWIASGSVGGRRPVFESADEGYSDSLLEVKSKVDADLTIESKDQRLMVSLLRLGAGIRGMWGSNQGDILAGTQRTEGERGIGGTSMKGRRRFSESGSTVGRTPCFGPCLLRLHRMILQPPMIMSPTTRKQMKPIRPAVAEGSWGIGLIGESELRAKIAEGGEGARPDSLSKW